MRIRRMMIRQRETICRGTSSAEAEAEGILAVYCPYGKVGPEARRPGSQAARQPGQRQAGVLILSPSAMMEDSIRASIIHSTPAFLPFLAVACLDAVYLLLPSPAGDLCDSTTQYLVCKRTLLFFARVRRPGPFVLRISIPS
ncbi:hypothetical protein BO70DRAFT_184565 [Aspergillus heteromorphus CBS 117.55]|uniref:Uncharacterized protein n=1 Tax=Aspergillus heteromorphus CBS 117.55 TaxID=1448321 RepID=A0A317WR61_9EURO|nr:uncharacterized protein BO70DRAFT_184565 [Aspergillus heteromorphus CBS 117.55]PWY88545.1 hypothetical protein BO70DRAFT_184565 [Aspergillus heteromorphus CBS 117.55]